MPADAPADPKDMAETLEAIARRLRRDEAPAPVPSPAPGAAGGLFVGVPAGAQDAHAPWLGEIDVFSDETHVTVTAETRNAEPSHVHVSVAAGRLLIGLGQGPHALKRDLPLPAPVDEEHAYATFRNGVLDVVLPRKGAPMRRGE